MFIVHAVVIFILIAGFGCFHYLLWGRSMSQQVAAEREEHEALLKEDWSEDGPHRPEQDWAIRAGKPRQPPEDGITRRPDA
jgi:hypothetical protein